MRRHESRATVHWEIDRRGKAVRWFCMGNERRRLIITREETRFSTWPSAFPGAWKWSDEHSCAEDEKINNSLRACIYVRDSHATIAQRTWIGLWVFWQIFKYYFQILFFFLSNIYLQIVFLNRFTVISKIICLF